MTVMRVSIPIRLLHCISYLETPFESTFLAVCPGDNIHNAVVSASDTLVILFVLPNSSPEEGPVANEIPFP